MCKSIFHQLAVKNVNVSVVITIYFQHNSILLRQKKYYSIHNSTGQNPGLSGLKNIWPVIMTGNLLSVIFSPVNLIFLSAANIFTSGIGEKKYESWEYMRRGVCGQVVNTSNSQAGSPGFKPCPEHCFLRQGTLLHFVSLHPGV